MKRFPLLAGLAAILVTAGICGWKQTQSGSPSVSRTPAPESPSMTAQRARRVNANEALGMNKVISGKVTFEDGAPAVGFRVGAYFTMHMTGAEGEGDAITDENGHYEIRGLTSMTFSVGPFLGNLPYLFGSKIVDLNPVSRVDHVDFVLKLGPKISLTVHDAETGKPVPGLLVFTNMSTQPDGTQPVTDSDGTATFYLGTLQPYLRVMDPDTSRGYDAAPGSTFLIERKLTESKPLNLELKAYRRATEAVPVTFRGTVYDEAGHPVVGAAVRLLRFSEIKQTTSDRHGHFSFETRRILPYEEQQGGGAVLFADKGDATTTKVPKAAETWGEIDLHLSSSNVGTIKGRVVDERGKPVSGCWITSWEFFNSGVQGSVQPADSGRTDEDGKFEIKRLHPGSHYSFRFGTHSDEGEIGFSDFPEDQQKGHSVEMNPGEVRDIGTLMVPRAPAKVSGTIVDTEGRAVTKNVTVILRGPHTYLPGYPDEKGQFLFKRVPVEPVKLLVFVGSNGGYRTDENGPDLLLSRTITPANQDLQLTVKMRPAKP